MKKYQLLLLVFLFACNQGKREQKVVEEEHPRQEFFKIEIRNSLKNQEKQYLSSIANEIRYIPLETTSSCMLTKIVDLKLYDGNIYVLDSKALYKFNDKGEFIQQIGMIGNGPGEYGMAFFFDIIEKNNEIMLYSYPAGEINFYDVETGIYKKSFKLDFDAIGSVEFPPGKICYFSSNLPKAKNMLVANEVFISNLDGHITDSIPNSRLQKTGNLSSQAVYYRMNDEVCYMGTFQDTLSILTQSMEKKPYAYFCLKNKIKGSEIKLKLLMGETQFPDFLSIHKVIESGRYFFIDIQKGVGLYTQNEILSFLYNKESNQLVNCSFFINDVDFGMPFWPQFICNSNLINIYQANEIIENIDAGSAKTNISENFQKMVSNLDLEDNPILAFVKLK